MLPYTGADFSTPPVSSPSSCSHLVMLPTEAGSSKSTSFITIILLTPSLTPTRRSLSPYLDQQLYSVQHRTPLFPSREAEHGWLLHNQGACLQCLGNAKAVWRKTEEPSISKTCQDAPRGLSKERVRCRSSQ